MIKFSLVSLRVFVDVNLQQNKIHFLPKESMRMHQFQAHCADLRQTGVTITSLVIFNPWPRFRPDLASVPCGGADAPPTTRHPLKVAHEVMPRTPTAHRAPHHTSTPGPPAVFVSQASAAASRRGRARGRRGVAGAAFGFQSHPPLPFKTESESST